MSTHDYVDNTTPAPVNWGVYIVLYTVATIVGIVAGNAIYQAIAG